MGHNDGRLIKAGAVALLIGLSTVGCGDDGPTEAEYPIPETFCGLDVSRNLYAPIFPPGTGDLSVEEDFTAAMPNLASVDRCRISLDDEQAILAETFAAGSFEDFLRSPGHDDLEEEYDVADGEPVEGEFDAMVWPGFVLAGAACEPGEGVPINSFTVGITAEYPEDDEESVRALSELIQPFMRAALEQSLCTPGDNPASEYSTGD
ncbi:hypothetical protein [Streptomyces sp. B6B3]|uniref:hypothetical protein n=1 Tax=Streptomyces sp. B6B3 TaxID=3153570 RepID=UPI00325DF8C7